MDNIKVVAPNIAMGVTPLDGTHTHHEFGKGRLCRIFDFSAGEVTTSYERYGQNSGPTLSVHATTRDFRDFPDTALIAAAFKAVSTSEDFPSCGLKSLEEYTGVMRPRKT